MNNNNNIANGNGSSYANSFAAGGGLGIGVGGGNGSGATGTGYGYQAAGGQCSFSEATIVKAIHAVCVSADQHQFPASHMVGDTWISSGYEGEVARCLPGSTLKVLIASLVQSDQGMATSPVNATTLTCGSREALRHYKNGMLKCAPVVPVPDCTERTNLRKWGTGDMFFSYVTKVCLEQHREMIGGHSRGGEKKETVITLRGMAMSGGIGWGSY